ncbi:Crp/Fnr family transcriptional regulator [Ferrovum sp. PN-J185]|uniref:Crp/Fnr family transcriptional regulator n=1 Tax=Ferrovum sp. PN-J185 TaxID=1356306 RepID=UPI000791E5FD|nr:Crp/Fnr family transcriptional regulator [Ferrovum sp. PN-J185]KXW56234.1 nitrogen fixation regulation protein FixK [Ferrovum sp. PN-J185]MCC6068956.1 Crp/Fnr family transcriptional regulator [Ferrovum sp. PN-J185]MDE1891064.1 Crp/Fnr family transcriptional regulator [Betaproteobacteria bacterium]MDE2055624.1 Crp/Fnr family transcriptional regulator [Betaproteobacteria bacterium]
MVQSTSPVIETPLTQHPLRIMLSSALRQNTVLHSLNDEQLNELETLLVISEVKKEDLLLAQGSVEMEQYFILEGLLKRVVSNPEGKEMILRFAGEKDIETSYAAWRLDTPAPYSIRAVTKVRVAKCPLPQWAQFMNKYPELKHDFEYEVMRLMSEIMAHTITLHLLDATGRMKRFQRKHPELSNLIPKKDLALHLNISPETLSRLLHQD